MSLKTAIYRSARPLSWVSRRTIATTMPLKARILEDDAPRRTSRRDVESKPEVFYNDSLIPELTKEQPGDEPDDVIFNSNYGVRTIELNRPKKLNSLNGSMARKIIPRLREWEKSQLANVVIIKGEGRAFCAGGDVAALAKQNKTPEGQEESKKYFALEYKLDHMIATYQKPYVAFMDGITMGGGVGLSVHAPFRIATENTVFAMPETTIGFFPDVGASFFLPKMDGQMGMYLALTSEQLKGVDVFYHGIATHYIHSTTLPNLQARLAELQFPDYATLEQRYAIIASTIEEFTSTLPSSRPAITGAVRNAIDDAFQHDDVNKILRSLDQYSENDDSTLAEWARKTKETIQIRSPTSVLVTLRMLRASKTRWSISEAFQREYNIAQAFMSHNDFVEGIEAKLIRRSKDRPKWKPNTLEEATSDQNIEQIEQFFPKMPENMPLLRSGEALEYRTYPHAHLALPTEEEIVKSFSNPQVEANRSRVVEYWLFQADGRVGVREKVEEVLERKWDAWQASKTLRK